jgi:hypothetical protein
MFDRGEQKCNILGIAFFIIVSLIELITIYCLIPAQPVCTYGLLTITILIFNGCLCYFARRCGRLMEDFHLAEEQKKQEHTTQE